MAIQTITQVKKEAELVLGEMNTASYIPTHTQFEWVDSANDRLVRTLKNGFLKKHTKGGANKTEQDHLGPDLTVTLFNYYDKVKFHDTEIEDAGSLAQKVKAHMLSFYARTIDAAIFGTEIWTDNQQGALTTQEVEVDGTSESWQTALDMVPNATFVVVDKRAKGRLRTAFSDGATTNTLRDGVVNEIGGLPVIYVNLYDDAPAAGEPIGAVVDGNSLVFLAKAVGGVSEFDPESDQTAFDENSISYGYRVSFGWKLRANTDAVLLTVPAA